MNIREAKSYLNTLRGKSKFNMMIMTAAILTKVLDKYDLKPIIVGGLSVEIYTNQEYSTRDIDFVSDGYETIADVLEALDFIREGRHYYHPEIEVAIEIPDNELAGSINKVMKLELDQEMYVYVISIEDIILDRLRATVYWKSEEDGVWAIKLINSHFTSLDIDYMIKVTKNRNEKKLLIDWLDIEEGPL